jgi:membrane-bound serine protease (ClpP class)
MTGRGGRGERVERGWLVPPPTRAGSVRAWAAAFLAGALVLLAGSSTAIAQQPGAPAVLAMTVDGPITPVMAAHVRDGITRAEREGYDALLVRLDTPGGLDTSMRSIIRNILAAEVPVLVHVAPPGARAASAGALITLSAHVAAMAPGTAIGAATPVAGQGGEDLDRKAINDAAAYAQSLAELRGRDVDFAVAAVREGRSIGAEEALRIGVVEFLASSGDELLAAIDGLVVEVGPAGREVTLRTVGATVDGFELSGMRSVQRFLADPNIAFLLLSLGTLALIYELASPGVGVGGVVGVTSVLIALFGLSVLPVNAVGIVFLVLAAALFVAELFAPGVGIAAAGGAACLVLAGIFLVQDVPGMGTSVAVVLPVAAVVGGAVLLAGRLVVRSRGQPSLTTGVGALIGQEAPVRVVGGRPTAFVGGAWWSLRSEGPPPAPGSTVRVVGMEGLDLVVEPLASGDEPPAVAQAPDGAQAPSGSTAAEVDAEAAELDTDAAGDVEAAEVDADAAGDAEAAAGGESVGASGGRTEGSEEEAH